MWSVRGDSRCGQWMISVSGGFAQFPHKEVYYYILVCQSSTGGQDSVEVAHWKGRRRIYIRRTNLILTLCGYVCVRKYWFIEWL